MDMHRRDIVETENKNNRVLMFAVVIWGMAPRQVPATGFVLP